MRLTAGFRARRAGSSWDGRPRPSTRGVADEPSGPTSTLTLAGPGDPAYVAAPGGARTQSRGRRLAVFVLLVGLVPLSLPAEDFPHWRGPARNGLLAESSGYRGGDWLAEHPAWRGQVGAGSTSPLVADGRVYVLGWQDGQDTVFCLDAATGGEVWRQAYPSPEYGRRATGDESFYRGPSATPEYDPDSGLLFTLGIDGDLRAWDGQTGAPAWSLNLYEKYDTPQRRKARGTRAPVRDYGYTTAPLVYGDTLIVLVGDDEGALMGFDKRTGERRWASPDPSPAGHAGGLAPLTVEGAPCLAALMLDGLLVIRLDAGHEGETVAWFDWPTDFANNIPSPAVDGDCVLITSKYNQHQMVKVRIRPGGAEEVWRAEQASGVCSPVVHGGRVYWATDRLVCLDAESGRLVWEGGRFGDAGSCLVTSDERLIAWGGNGVLALADTAALSPDSYRELFRREGLGRNDVWPHVVLSGGRLYLKDRHGALSCFVVAAGDDGAAAGDAETDNSVEEDDSPPAAEDVGEETPDDAPTVPPPTPDERDAALAAWPGDDPSIVLAWRRDFGTDRVLGPLAPVDEDAADGGDAVEDEPSPLRTEWRLALGGAARADRFGALRLAGGMALVDQASEPLCAAFRERGEFTLEAVLLSEQAEQTGPARIVSFSSNALTRNFTLGQEGARLILRLRTPETGDNGASPESQLCELPACTPVHVAVTYRDGELCCFRDGKLAVSSDAVRGDFGNWTPEHQLLLGDELDGGRNWAGALERVALYTRALSADEVRRLYRLWTTSAPRRP